MKIPNECELQQIAINHSSDFDFKDFFEPLQEVYLKNKFFLSRGYNFANT